MIPGVMLLLFGGFFLEQGTVIKKKLGNEIDINQISLLTMMATAICGGIVLLIQNDWHYELTLVSFLLLVFQILGAVIFQFLSNKAVHYADRSTFSVLSTITIPLLLIFDVMLGYDVTVWHIIGGIILLIMLVYTMRKGDFSLKGIKYVIASNLVSLCTIVAFKYSTAHFGSTELVNFYNAFFAGILFTIIVARTKGAKGIVKIFRPKYLGFATVYGIASVLNAAAYKYMISSMVIALKRFFAMMFGVISGKLYFHEKNLLRKLSVAGVMGVGVFVMNIGPLLSVSFSDATTQPQPIHASASNTENLLCLAIPSSKELKRSKQTFEL